MKKLCIPIPFFKPSNPEILFLHYLLLFKSTMPLAWGLSLQTSNFLQKLLYLNLFFKNSQLFLKGNLSFGDQTKGLSSFQTLRFFLMNLNFLGTWVRRELEKLCFQYTLIFSSKLSYLSRIVSKQKGALNHLLYSWVSHNKWLWSDSIFG